MKFNYIAHDNQSKSMKNSDQVSCPASTGKEKWIKLTGPVTFIQKFFFRLSQPVEYKKIVFFFFKKS